MGDFNEHETLSKGGGYRGGPKRWTGKGPAPARHIPWPEIFKHHQSVLTGHIKMVDMIRKHCAEGSGNYEMADSCVHRAQDMLRDFKRLSGAFVPPKDQFERTPIGVSSASMYPGYSPADHVYGEAAEEFGTQVAEMRKKGKDWKPTNGLEYIVGQSSVSERKNIEEHRKRRSESAGEVQTTRAQRPASTTDATDPMEGVETGDAEAKPLFFIDSNPTPLHGLEGAIPSSGKEKRKVSFGSAEEIKSEDRKKKKVGSSKSDDVTSNPAAISTNGTSSLEEDDISAEVEARLKAKEEKRNSKKDEKKRKRDSGHSSAFPESSTEVATQPSATSSVAAEPETTKKNKSKKKKQKSDANIEEPNRQPLPSVTEEVADGKEKKKEKKNKKKREGEASTDGLAAESADDGATGNVDEGEKRKKKRKKDH